MNGVARSADNVCLAVAAAAYIRPAQVLVVTAQTGVENLVRRQFRKRDDRPLTAFGVDVLFARSVTALATRVLGRRVGRNGRLVVRIAKELQSNLRMAGAAGIITGEGGVRWSFAFRRRLRKNSGSGNE